MYIIEAIKQRRSVRSFDGNGLTADEIQTLENAVKNSFTPFGGDVTIRLKRFDLKGVYKPGTYGTIRGAVDFFLIGMGSDEASQLSVGFRFEQVVLKAWEAGLGCCWIAGTFKSSDFNRGESWPAGEELKVICPTGHAAQRSMMESITRLALGSKNRKPFDKLFFYDDFDHAVPMDSRYAEPLEMLRLAPSSTNSQPWRVLVIGDTVHFYYKPKSKISVLDCGIGMCHFYETERYRGHNGRFEKIGGAPTPPDDWKYLMSYIGDPV